MTARETGLGTYAERKADATDGVDPDSGAGGDATGADDSADKADDGEPAVVDPLALTDNTWPACGDLTCSSEQYLNPLACQCFARSVCSAAESGCVPGESALLPTEQCTCAPFADIRALYPTWASLGDVEKAQSDGLAAALKADQEAKPDVSIDDVVPQEPIVDEGKYTENDVKNDDVTA